MQYACNAPQRLQAAHLVPSVPDFKAVVVWPLQKLTAAAPFQRRQPLVQQPLKSNHDIAKIQYFAWRMHLHNHGYMP